MNFSAETHRLLKNAGWFTGRKIDITEYEKALNAEGYEVYEIVRDFLSCFGGLKVIHPHHRVPESNDEFHFDSIEACRQVFANIVLEDYSERVKTPLCIIGQAYRGYMVLMMNENGKVYAGYDELLILVGESGEKAIECLCSGGDRPKID